MPGTAVLSLLTGRLEKRAFLATKGEGRGCQWAEVNVQSKLGLPLYFAGLPGVSDYFFVCFLKTESDWKKPENTCTPALARPSFEQLFLQSVPTRSSDL